MPRYKWVTAAEFARETGVRYPTILDYCKRGLLPSLNVGRGKKTVLNIPEEEALQALETLMRVPKVEAEPQTSAGDLADKVLPISRAKVKIYKQKRAKALPDGFDFQSSMKALLG